MSNPEPSLPGRLDLVRDFVNTRNPEDGADQLRSPVDLHKWLLNRGLLSEGRRATEAELELARALREALRALLLFNNDGGQPDPAAEELLNAAAQAAGLGVRFSREGTSLHAGAGGVAGALGRLLCVVAEAMAAGTWPRLKACRAGTCLWAFYDHSKNQSRAWCSMAVCGNRTKVKNYRRRREG